MSPSMCLIVPLVVWYVLMMMFYWWSSRQQNVEAPVSREVCFAIREGQTILGVMDASKSICFCIGKIEEHVHEEEDTVE
jgi:hypothetical protein